MEEKEKLAKAFWASAHMGAAVFNPYEEHRRPKSEDTKNTVSPEVRHKDEGYKAFQNGGIFGNGYAFDAVMFNVLF